MYLHVTVVPSRQPHGQLTPGPGTAFPQPTHFRRELPVRGGGGAKQRGGRAEKGEAGEAEEHLEVITSKERRSFGWGYQAARHK